MTLSNLDRIKPMEILKKLDLRTSTDADGNKYFIVFCARESDNPTALPGHAYVVWGVENAASNMSSQKSFGFYPDPNDASKAVFTTVSGTLVNEATQNASSSLLTARLIAQVNKQPYTDSQSQIALWQTSDYNLFSNNCISFVRSVALSIGLFPPDIGTFNTPTKYLEKLINNTGSQPDLVSKKINSPNNMRVVYDTSGDGFDIDIRISLRSGKRQIHSIQQELFQGDFPTGGNSCPVFITCGETCNCVATPEILKKLRELALTTAHQMKRDSVRDYNLRNCVDFVSSRLNVETRSEGRSLGSRFDINNGPNFSMKMRHRTREIALDACRIYFEE